MREYITAVGSFWATSQTRKSDAVFISEVIYSEELRIAMAGDSMGPYECR